MTDQLVDNAGLEPLQDRYFSGYIAAFNDVIKAEIDFTEES